MRNVWFVLKFILACILGFVLQLTLHEMGHAVFALITGNEVVNVSLGIVSYAVVNVLNEWSIPVISVGSFVFPIVVCAFLALFRSEFVRCLSAVILTITTPFSLKISRSFNTNSPTSPAVLPSIKISSIGTTSSLSTNLPLINVATCPFNLSNMF